MTPLVTIGVPIYRGAGLLERCLQGIAEQTYSNLEVLLSIDGRDAASVEACRPFLPDPRFHLLENEERLGWAGNLNRTLSRRTGDFFLYQQQDDWFTPTYVEDLVAAAATWRDASICYAEMIIVGTDDLTVRHKPILGPPLSRFLAHLERMDTSMFRGLVRGSAAARAGLLVTGEHENFGSDLAWMARLAAEGEFRFVPGPSYFKHLHAANTHTRWYDWPEGRKRGAWAALGAWMLEAALDAGGSLAERRVLFDAVLDRFLVPRGGDRWFFAELDETDPEDRAAMLAMILDCVEDRLRLDWLARRGPSPEAVREAAAERFTPGPGRPRDAARNGGRGWDRTSDPYDVNVVLSR